MTLIWPPGTELRHILAANIMFLSDLDLWPLDLGVMSCDATLVVKTCAEFEVDRTYCSRVTKQAICPSTLSQIWLGYWHPISGGHTSELLCHSHQSPQLKETWRKLTNTWLSWWIVSNGIITQKPIKQNSKQITKCTNLPEEHSVFVVNINLMQINERILSKLI